jgi:hypothetical protein
MTQDEVKKEQRRFSKLTPEQQACQLGEALLMYSNYLNLAADCLDVLHARGIITPPLVRNERYEDHYIVGSRLRIAFS